MKNIMMYGLLLITSALTTGILLITSDSFQEGMKAFVVVDPQH